MYVWRSLAMGDEDRNKYDDVVDGDNDVYEDDNAVDNDNHRQC